MSDTHHHVVRKGVHHALPLDDCLCVLNAAARSYPFAHMQPGQHFHAPYHKPTTVRSAIVKFQKRNPTQRHHFIASTTKDGIRVWRLA